MDLSFTPEEEAFRAEVRAFLDDNLSDDLVRKNRNSAALSKADMEDWHAKLNTKGWLAATWPSEYGGTGWGAVERHIFEEECALANAPRTVPFGLNMLGPVLIKFGTEAQKAEILPRILDGSDWWCQGYSEPGAGSDLASLKTRAVREGDAYVINGQKTWTTLGQYANKIFCLVRTSNEGKPQEGISFVLVDMDTPGVELRPIRLLEGGYEVNEVFFTDVHVPVTNLVGQENKGWTIAKYLLTHERTNIAGVGFSTRDLDKLKMLSQTLVRGGRPLCQDPLFAAEMTEVEIDLEALRIMNLRMLSAAKEGAASGTQSSMLKIKGTVIRQRILSLTRSALGSAAAPFPADELPENVLSVPEEAARAAASYFNNRKLSIFGGSNEIQRNIIAKDLFGG
ncbi:MULTISPECIES: acyl-CoA dehydrogenase family protein [unclassified Ruegeria]|uniref:acyl-CoA dehydrogenase family protein n=1 Tax=unclassified Ruegeria TaxID=2625375 RepID=UPI001ADAE093|nr:MULTISPECIES: acyl-CoA dehydrogenase family protein [unclassified Ruegeria]MBO9413624.1 acyl-CoA dehydrogenase family protein [Ruegeria sp. R8_1]MBO9417610.1 acyl-CoA dehydrogenase family protein [Ruegeria sp. R8_2]